jgi:hypothetical protein
MLRESKGMSEREQRRIKREREKMQGQFTFLLVKSSVVNSMMTVEAVVRLLPFLVLGLLVMPALSADLDADGDGEVTAQEFLSHQVLGP